MKSLLIRSTLTALARLGVAEVCVAAGARNAPLITALLASDGVKLWSFFEERCAGFFALGRMMADRMPVAVVTTSGTAAAELLPAVIEAHYQGLPLVVVTADRPRRFRGSGAPQAIEQKDLFGPYVSTCVDVEEGMSIAWPTRLGERPLHINVCLDEPLDVELHGIDFLRHQPQKPLKPAKLPAFIVSGEPTAVVVCGLHPYEAREVAPVLEALALPVIAEATSNLWGCFPERPGLARLLLPAGEATFQGLEIRQVIRIGGIPSARWWRDLESRPEIWVTNISRLPFAGLARKKNVQTLPWHALETLAEMSLVPARLAGARVPTAAATAVLPPKGTALVSLATLGTATADVTVAPTEKLSSTKDKPTVRLRAGAKAAAAAVPVAAVQEGDLQELAAAVARRLADFPLSEPAWMRRLLSGYAARDRVFVGNSLPIREMNLALAPPAQGVEFYANRGANGIDGVVSSWLGVSASSRSSWLVVGDLSALYDLAAPWIMPQLPQGNRRLVIINNHGGKIFSRVKGLSSLPGEVRHVIENHHRVSFEPWARMWGLSYVLATRPEDLEELPDGAVLVEVVPDARQTEKFYEEV